MVEIAFPAFVVLLVVARKRQLERTVGRADTMA